MTDQAKRLAELEEAVAALMQHQAGLDRELRDLLAIALRLERQFVVYARLRGIDVTTAKETAH